MIPYSLLGTRSNLANCLVSSTNFALWTLWPLIQRRPKQWVLIVRFNLFVLDSLLNKFRSLGTWVWRFHVYVSLQYLWLKIGTLLQKKRFLHFVPNPVFLAFPMLELKFNLFNHLLFLICCLVLWFGPALCPWNFRCVRSIVFFTRLSYCYIKYYVGLPTSPLVPESVFYIF